MYNEIRTFEQEMELQMPNYAEIVTGELLIKFRTFYQDYLDAKQVANRCFELGLRSRSGIDYSNDYQKASERAAECWRRFQNLMDGLKEFLEIEEANEMGRSR